jgi:hypothetical protein
VADQRALGELTMRVVCHTVDEFLENLYTEQNSSILQQTIHISVTHRPLGTSNKNEVVRFVVTIHASAVICLPNGGEYLLDYGEDCGHDYHDADEDLSGTNMSDKIREKIVSFCDDRDIKVRSGIIET